MTDKEIRALIENRRKDWRYGSSVEAKYKAEECKDILELIDSLQEEPASIDFEQELYKAFGQVKDFTLGMRIAKWFYDMGRNSQEPVSEDLEEAVKIYTASLVLNGEGSDLTVKQLREVADKCFKAGAKWQLNKMMEDAIETSVMAAFAIGLHIEVKLDPNKYSFGDKVKVIIIKED